MVSRHHLFASQVEFPPNAPVKYNLFPSPLIKQNSCRTGEFIRKMIFNKKLISEARRLGHFVTQENGLEKAFGWKMAKANKCARLTRFGSYLTHLYINLTNRPER